MTYSSMFKWFQMLYSSLQRKWLQAPACGAYVQAYEYVLNQLVCVSLFIHFLHTRMRAGKNLRYYERALEKTGQSELINTRLCGNLCCCSEKVRWTR